MTYWVCSHLVLILTHFIFFSSCLSFWKKSQVDYEYTLTLILSLFDYLINFFLVSSCHLPSETTNQWICWQLIGCCCCCSDPVTWAPCWWWHVLWLVPESTSWTWRWWRRIRLLVIDPALCSASQSSSDRTPSRFWHRFTQTWFQHFQEHFEDLKMTLMNFDMSCFHLYYKPEEFPEKRTKIKI